MNRIKVFSILLLALSIGSSAMATTLSEPALQDESFGVDLRTEIAAENIVKAEQNRYCRVLRPGTRDMANRYCRNGYYAAEFDGYIIDDTCFSTINGAVEKMRNTNTCDLRPPVSFRFCDLTNPSERDDARRYCDKAYAYSYDFYIVDNNCFRSLDTSVDRMMADPACRMQARQGSCSIANPNEQDRNQRFCRNAYGIMYRGEILNNRCYSKLEQAMDRMRGTVVCRR